MLPLISLEILFYWVLFFNILLKHKNPVNPIKVYPSNCMMNDLEIKIWEKPRLEVACPDLAAPVVNSSKIKLLHVIFIWLKDNIYYIYITTPSCPAYRLLALRLRCREPQRGKYAKEPRCFPPLACLLGNSFFSTFRRSSRWFYQEPPQWS